MASRMVSAAARAASWKSWPSPPVFCQAHMMEREALTMAPQPFLSKAYCTSSAVPPWAHYPGTRKKVWGIRARRSFSSWGQVAPVTAPTGL